MAWAVAHDHVVLTHDLDFGTILALTHAVGPSVVQIRGQDVVPEALGVLVIDALVHHAPELAQGAIVVVDAGSHRSRVLPIRSGPAHEDPPSTVEGKRPARRT